MLEHIKKVIRIGKKVVGAIQGAIRIGHKAKAFLGGGGGTGRVGSKAQELSPKAKSLSSQDFIIPEVIPKIVDEAEKRIPQPIITRGLETAGKGRQILQGVKAVKREAGLIKSLQEGKDEKEKLKTLQRQKARLSAEASAPSKKSFKKTAAEQRALQQAQLVGSMSQKELKKFLKKQEKKAKKR